jgi:hypothetical protein
MIVIFPLLIAVVVTGWILRPRTSSSRARKAAALAVSVLSAVVALASIGFQLIHKLNGPEGVSEVSNSLFVVDLGIVVAAMLAAVGLVIARKSEMAKGLGFGTCVAVAVCVAELGLLEWMGGV